MISAIHEVRNACYGNINTLAFYVLLIYQLIQFRQKRIIPSFCVDGVQKCFTGINQHFFGTVSQELPWYKKVSNKILSFLSKDYFWIILEIYIMANFIQYNGVFNKSFGKSVGTGANYFALLFFNGALYILYCCVVGINPLKQLDWAAPSYPLALIFAKIACFCAGCCWGIEWEHGLYNYRTERYEVSTQLIEMSLALLIFIFMMLYKKKAKRGTLFPIYLIVYCGTRFFSEFLRREENVLGPFKMYHILCVIGIVVGIVLLLVVKIFGDKIDAHFDKNYRGVIGVIVKKVKGIEDDGTYTEQGKIRAEKIKEIKEKHKKKIEKAKKRRKIRKRKAQIKF